jgi:hypothetical protein
VSRGALNRALTLRSRLVLATLAAVLVAASLAVLLAARTPRATRRPAISSGPRAVNVAAVAATVRRQINTQLQAAATRQWMLAHHEFLGPAVTPPPGTATDIQEVDATIRRWLAGYLPYEVDRLDSVDRRILVDTSTEQLARKLLEDPPLIPPTAHQAPPAGRAVAVLASVDANRHRASAYVEVAYSLERVGLQLTLTRGAARWQVAALHG